MVLWRLIRPSRTNTQKRCHFHYKGLECKSRKSRDTWSNRQIWPWGTEWNRAKGNRVLPREHTGHSSVFFQNTRLYTWTSPDGQYWNQIEYILCSKHGEALYSQQKQDWELTVAQIMNSLLQNSDLKKVRKTTRPFNIWVKMLSCVQLFATPWGLDSPWN